MHISVHVTMKGSMVSYIKDIELLRKFWRAEFKKACPTYKYTLYISYNWKCQYYLWWPTRCSTRWRTGSGAPMRRLGSTLWPPCIFEPLLEKWRFPTGGGPFATAASCGGKEISRMVLLNHSLNEGRGSWRGRGLDWLCHPLPCTNLKDALCF